MKIGDVLSIDRDGFINIDEDTEYTIAGVQCYGKGVINRRNSKGSELTMKKYQVIKPNQLMWCKVDTKNGAFGITKPENVGSLASTNMCLANIDTNKIIPDLLQKFFQFPFFYENITKQSTGTTNRQYLTPPEFLETIEIPDWDIESQSKTLKKINSFEKAGMIQKIEILDNNLTKIKKQILNLAIQGKLVSQDPNDEPAEKLLEKIKIEKEKLVKEGKIKKEKLLPSISKNEIPFELPKGWAWSRFQDITKVITCGVASTPNYKETGSIFLSAQNIKPYKFLPSFHRYISREDFEKYTRGSKPEINDILLTRVGAGIGEAAIIDQDIEFAIYVSLTLIKPVSQFVEPKYLLHWLNSEEGVKKSLKHTFGKGVSVGNLNVNQVRQFVLPIPPLKEQNRIVEKVESLSKICDEQEKHIAEAKENINKLNQAILREMFN